MRSDIRKMPIINKAEPIITVSKISSSIPKLILSTFKRIYIRANTTLKDRKSDLRGTMMIVNAAVTIVSVSLTIVIVVLTIVNGGPQPISNQHHPTQGHFDDRHKDDDDRQRVNQIHQNRVEDTHDQAADDHGRAASDLRNTDDHHPLADDHHRDRNSPLYVPVTRQDDGDACPRREADLLRQRVAGSVSPRHNSDPNPCPTSGRK